MHHPEHSIQIVKLGGRSIILNRDSDNGKNDEMEQNWAIQEETLLEVSKDSRLGKVQIARVRMIP